MAKQEKSAAKPLTKKPQNGSETANAGPAGGTGSSGLPPMYDSVQALAANRHAGLRLAPSNGHANAAKMSSIILGASEFAAAARNYPVVFSDDETDAMAYVVTGYANGVNLYVDAKGAWRKETYIPAYVRRYPFIFIESEAGKRLTLAIDRNGGWFSETNGTLLYEADGTPSSVTKNGLAFCRAYKTELDRTRVLVRQIVDCGITISRRAEITLPGNKKAMISGFRIVDEKKLAELPDATFLELRKSGALTLIYCHLMSMLTWKNMLA